MPTFSARKGSPGMRKCAFCTHYYDPVNSAINPKRGTKDVWEYTTGIKKPCTEKNNHEVCSQATCHKFQCKL